MITVKDMLENKYKFTEDEIFQKIDELEAQEQLEEASKIFLCYVNLIMSKIHAIRLDAERPLLEYIRAFKADRFEEEIEDSTSVVKRCTAKPGIQLDKIYY